MRINNWRQNKNWAVLDTETTGMSAHDQVVELTLLSATGDVAFNSLVKPSVPIHYMAAKTHGLSLNDLSSAPTWPEIHRSFEEAVRQFDVILIFNKSFDIRLINQTYKAFNIMPPSIPNECVMEAFKEYLSISGGSSKGKMSLDAACETIGIDPLSVDRHRSYGDCVLTRDLILKTPILKNIEKEIVNEANPISGEAYKSSSIKKPVSGVLSSLVAHHVSSSNSLTELHLSLKEVGVDVVLTGPNMEKRSFSGIVFYQGNNKTSGSQIGKNYSLKK